MPDTETDSLSALVVKEAVERGLETPMREPILEAVRESEDDTGSPQLPVVGAVFGLGTAVGFLLGKRAEELDIESVPVLEEPTVAEDLTEELPEAAPELEDSTATDESGSNVPKLLLGGILAIVGAVAIRRRLTRDEDDWEPIEEFEPAETEETGPARPDAVTDDEEPDLDDEVEE